MSSGIQALTALSSQQKELVVRVERLLMAPCCYTQTIDVHLSEIAEQMRTEVVQMVVSGLNETSIYAHYKERYGEQILAVPDGRLGQIAFAIPLTVTTVASGLLSLLLYKLHRRKAQMALVSGPVETGLLSAGKQARLDEIRRATKD